MRPRRRWKAECRKEGGEGASSPRARRMWRRGTHRDRRGAPEDARASRRSLHQAQQPEPQCGSRQCCSSYQRSRMRPAPRRFPPPFSCLVPLLPSSEDGTVVPLSPPSSPLSSLRFLSFSSVHVGGGSCLRATRSRAVSHITLCGSCLEASPWYPADGIVRVLGRETSASCSH